MAAASAPPAGSAGMGTSRAPTPAAPPGAPSAAPVDRVASVADREIARHDTVRAGRWTVSGTVKVTNDVEVEVADLRGTVSVGGTLRAGRLASRGSLEVERATQVRETVVLRGDARFASTVAATDAEVDGTLRTDGAVTVERTLSGQGTVHAPSVAVGTLRFEGAVRVPGKVEAKQVDLVLSGDSELGTVFAPEVRIRGKLPNLLDKVFFHEQHAHVVRIEAERVELEGVDVDFVRAREIGLGRGCHVREVEGSVVHRHPTSSVGPRSKSVPPYGLRR